MERLQDLLAAEYIFNVPISDTEVSNEQLLLAPEFLAAEEAGVLDGTPFLVRTRLARVLHEARENPSNARAKDVAANLKYWVQASRALKSK